MDLNEYLVQLSDDFDSSGNQKCANVIDDLIKHQSLTKVAQYVGAIGYVLKQNRAMSNCIRNKRVTADASVSMQEVVMECLKEYQDGQDYNNNEWTSKYASLLKTEPSQFKKSHLYYLASIGQENNIDQHLARLENASAMLDENNIEDNMIKTVLSHVKLYGDMLNKDAE